MCDVDAVKAYIRIAPWPDTALFEVPREGDGFSQIIGDPFWRKGRRLSESEML